MKFNSANCVDKSGFSHNVPCIEFVVGSKLKFFIELEKPTTMDPEINIQPVNTKFFFHMAQKKNTKVF